MATEHYIYIVRCKDGTLYTGYTNNVEARIEKHNAGKGAKYTKTRRPVVLVYQEGYETKSEAMKREYEIKTFTRTQKLQLIERGKQ
ncbi:GIY-YIG nuclease family protein [Staphylococcus simulans]|uniref:GIY-YIG nuclease family protein n=1 Tax=Staphylococcus simulans TaxID=1286 RepID=UPI00399BE5D6